MVSLILALCALAPLVSAATNAATAPHPHEHASDKRLPTHWHQPRSHEAHRLFRRADSASPSPGSPAWAANFPVSTPAASQIPAAWTAALSAAVAAGNIPSVPQTSESNGAVPTYPSGTDPMSPQVCSATYKCRIDGDIWDAPDGVFGVGFDDGPLPDSSTKLYSFLGSQNQTATHFMIGVNIMNDLADFNTALSLGHDFAVHTWTHPYMTTLSNEDIVGQLGFTMQAIHDLTGGRLPRYWRPPYGDSDLRVRSIARSVFGLETIIWNQDTNDWSLTSGGTTPAKVASALNGWLTGPKTPGLIILEHELSDMSVQAFIDAYPSIKANGWKPISVTAMTGAPYQNADDDTSPVTSAADIILSSTAALAPSSSSTSSPPPTTSSTPSSSSSASSTSKGAAAQAVSHSASPSATSGAPAAFRVDWAPVGLTGLALLVAYRLLA